MSFPRYPKYKDSGVEWLGEVPEHWDVRSIRHCLSELFNGLTSTQVDETELTVPVTRIETISTGTIDESRLGFINPEDARDDRMLRAGDILFSNINSLNMIGNCAIYVGGRVIFAGMNLLVLRPATGSAPRWLYWLIRSSTFREVVESLAKPAINQASISQSSINSITIPVPLHDEQTAIASFLDRETAKIDELVAEQRRLIELLKEKRQAVISHAVTKGLNPNVPLRPSGIEWLGDIPEHWDVVPVKRLIEVKDGTHATPAYVDPSDDAFPLITSKDFDAETISFDDAKYISASDHIEVIKRSNTEQGDVLMSMIGGNIGKALIVQTSRQFSIKNVALFKTNGNPDMAQFLIYYLQSGLLDVQIDLLSRGGAQGFLGLGDLRNLVFFKLPSSELSEIIKNLTNYVRSFTELHAEAQRGIELLQERRTALISAAVTGKIDVRELSGGKSS